MIAGPGPLGGLQPSQYLLDTTQQDTSDLRGFWSIGMVVEEPTKGDTLTDLLPTCRMWAGLASVTMSCGIQGPERWEKCQNQYHNSELQNRFCLVQRSIWKNLVGHGPE